MGKRWRREGIRLGSEVRVRWGYGLAVGEVSLWEHPRILVTEYVEGSQTRFQAVLA